MKFKTYKVNIGNQEIDYTPSHLECFSDRLASVWETDFAYSSHLLAEECQGLNFVSKGAPVRNIQGVALITYERTAPKMENLGQSIESFNQDFSESMRILLYFPFTGDGSIDPYMLRVMNEPSEILSLHGPLKDGKHIILRYFIRDLKINKEKYSHVLDSDSYGSNIGIPLKSDDKNLLRKDGTFSPSFPLKHKRFIKTDASNLENVYLSLIKQTVTENYDLIRSGELKNLESRILLNETSFDPLWNFFLKSVQGCLGQI